MKLLHYLDFLSFKTTLEILASCIAVAFLAVVRRHLRSATTYLAERMLFQIQAVLYQRASVTLDGAKELYLHQNRYSILRSRILLYFCRDPELDSPFACTQQLLSSLNTP